MQSPKTEDDKLQMFFDGELTPEEEAAMRRDLERSAEGMAQLREWEQIRDAMLGAIQEDYRGHIGKGARVYAAGGMELLKLGPGRATSGSRQQQTGCSKRRRTAPHQTRKMGHDA